MRTLYAVLRQLGPYCAWVEIIQKVSTAQMPKIHHDAAEHTSRTWSSQVIVRSELTKTLRKPYDRVIAYLRAIEARSQQRNFHADVGDKARLMCACVCARARGYDHT